MTVVLTGSDLTIEDVVAVASRASRSSSSRRFSNACARRALVERVVERGDIVYGMTTGVGARKKTLVPPEEIPAFNRALIANHRTASGPDAHRRSCGR